MNPASVISVLCVFGILVSIYALRVEILKESDDNYEAMCDISEHMRCTHVLTSRWGRGFGVLGLLLGEDSILNQPNSIAGIAFYTTVLINFSSSLTAAKTLLIMAVASNLMSLYLASILYFILHDFCVVCVTTYAINFGLLCTAWQKKKTLFKKID